MRFSRPSRGIVALAAILALFALYFNVLSAALAGGALIIFLTARAFIFLFALSSTASSLTYKRLLLVPYASQGCPVNVDIHFKVKIPPGFTAEISDLPPQGAVLSSGTPIASLQETDFGRLNYSLIFKTIGAHAFKGIRLSLSDQFFSHELICGIPETTFPSIIILPSSEFPLPIESFSFEKGSSIIPPFTSPEVKSFRAALPGDDFRNIDWKLSAKYDKLFIREYMGMVEPDTLLIIDLPDARLPFSVDAFLRMKEAVLNVFIMQSYSQKGLAVLLICGSNLISFIPSGSDSRQLLDVISKIAPTVRLQYMYRYRSTAALKSRFSPLAGSADSFLKNLFRISDALLAHRLPSTFESQVSRILLSISATTAHIFTLNIHDNSHIQIISELAVIKGMNIQFHIIREVNNSALNSWFNRDLASAVAGI